MTVPYVIWAPPYTHRSGGVRALYKLRTMLNAAAQNAYMQPFENGQPIGNNGARADAIVVYPEIIVGNPAGAERYVRWLLGPVERDGLCFQWLPSFGDRPALHVPIVETGLFHPSVTSREGVAVWAGKATAEHYARHLPAVAKELQRDDPSTRAELAAYLGRIKHLVSLDAFSSLNLEAAMCGTPVRVHTDGKWTRAQLQSVFVSTAGMAFDDEPWEYATGTVEFAYDRYRAAKASKVASVERFIAITQQEFAS